ncbi:VOC family protein [Nocardia fluminea]|uniref:VOC family protein n=1 Tax=Nocardia fluminea TaxID=134984 RepID=UPI001B804494
MGNRNCDPAVQSPGFRRCRSPCWQARLWTALIPRPCPGFYRELTGTQLGYDTDEFVALTDSSGCDLGFQRVDGYQAPRWPGQDVPQQLHLDLRGEDLDAAEKSALGFGAVSPTTSRAATGGGYCWIRPVTRSA